MDLLWAPWRMAYIGAAKEPGCIFCSKPAEPDRRAALVLARTPHAAVLLNRYPYSSGHVMVAPRRHTADLCALTAEEYGKLSEVLRRTMALMQQALHPDGLNVGMNLGAAAGAGIVDHLHWHVVPRWIGDTNYMPLIGEVRVIPEHLETLYERLAPCFAALEEPDSAP